MNKNDIIEKRLRAVEAYRNTLSAAEKDGMTSDIKQKLEQIEADIDKYSVELEQATKLEKFENDLNRPLDAKAFRSPQKDKEVQAFFNFLRTGDRAEYALQVGASAGSNVKVPTPTSVALYDRLAELSVVRQNAEIIQTDSTVDLGIGGQTSAYWVNENGEYTASNAMGTHTLSAYKSTALVKASEEILQDNTFNLEGYIVNEAANAFSELEEAAYLVGDGSGKPTGIFNLSTYAGTAVSSGSSVSGSSLFYDDLVDIFYGMKAQYRRNASWVFESSAVKQIRKIKDTTGMPIWIPATRSGEADTLFGRPVLISDAMTAFGASTTIGGLVDFTNVVVGDRGPITVQRLDELYAASGQVGWKFFRRTDIALKSPHAVHKMETL